MATRKQKNRALAYGSALGLAAGVYLALYWGYEIFPLAAKAGVIVAALAVLGALAARRMARWWGAAEDTIIYTLRYRGKIVYVGIAYRHRIGGRISEHRRSDKRFDRVDMSKPRTRKEALRIEAMQIRRWQPKYTVMHKS